ncbi:hypothetical protein [Effusibacillus pohliae]|uniref:hypothetical protein n=1 Tax=Effusibacillus pohliae TaxID=232270 RepID=UPI000378644F|nr:hypothetical protein [Effusibacillus pohliae]
MKLLFESFRTINRNLGMIWPPVVTALGFLLLLLIPVVFLAVSFRGLFEHGLRRDQFDPDLLFGVLGPGVLVLLFVLFLLFLLLGLFVTAFFNAGLYQLASSVLDRNRHYWRSYFKGGFRFLGWSVLFVLISFGINLLADIVGSLVLLGNQNGKNAEKIVSFLLGIVVQYLLILFYPALIDGKEKFGKALGTSFRFAWQAFLETILPVIGLFIAGMIIVFTLVGIGAVTHPVISVLIAIPLGLYLIPLLPVWATLVYRKLTPPAEPTDPAATDLKIG